MNKRVEAVRSRLREENVDAFFSIHPPVNQYLSDFRGSTSGIIITQSEALFFCDFRYTEQAEKQVSGFTLEEINGSMISCLAERLNKLRCEKVRCEAEYLSVADMGAFKQIFQGELIPGKSITADLRMIKEKEEIDAIREALSLSESVLTDLLHNLHEGITERELAARFEYEFKCRGASGPSFNTIALFGERSSLPHGEPGDRPLHDGDIILLDFGCVLNGYCSDLTRTYVFGTICPEWFEEIYALVLAAQAEACAAVRPGMTGKDVDAVARDIISRGGYGSYFGHGLGHGVGIEVHESPRLNPRSEVILKPGMVITIEPGIYLPGKGGVRIEDVVVVTESGREILSNVSRDLKVLTI